MKPKQAQVVADLIKECEGSGVTLTPGLETETSRDAVGVESDDRKVVEVVGPRGTISQL